MRIRSGILAVLLSGISVFAQDGIYGSFIVGQKFIDFSSLNAEMIKIGTQSDIFPSNNWTFGGEGHMIIANHLVVGGKAFGISHERVIQPYFPATDTITRRVRMTAGMGVGSVGINILPPNKAGLHIYPQAGIGASSFIFQSKRVVDTSFKQWDEVLVNENDNMTTIGKLGLIVDVSAGLDWYKAFKNFFTILPGLDLGIMLHGEVGYSFLPGNLKWRRDFDLNGKDQIEGGPDLKFNGFYFNVGLGLGLTAE